MEANPQEVVTETILKDSQLKRWHAASWTMPLVLLGVRSDLHGECQVL